jgi:hypothetical protein
MLSRPFRAVPLLLFCSALVAQGQITTAITGARVIDGTGTAAHIETVILRDNRIVAVSDRAAIPAGARIVDATGHTLMPGLFDLHIHLNASGTDAVDDFGKNLKAYLVGGVSISALWRVSTCPRPRHRIGVATAARRRHRLRPGLQSVADAVCDTGDLSLLPNRPYTQDSRGNIGREVMSNLC